MKKTLLFVTYGGGHVHMVYPVIHALQRSNAYKNGQIDIQVLALPAARKILLEQGITPLGFIDYLDKEHDADALAWGEELAKTHHSSTIGVPKDRSVAYLGLNYKDLVTRFGEKEAKRLFEQKSRQAFYPLTIMERIFDDLKPDFVVTTNSPRSEAAAIEIANRRGIDNLIMTDLFARVALCNLNARNLTFINHYAKDMLVEEGYIKEGKNNLYFTGNPAFDKILTLPTQKDPAWLASHYPEAVGRSIVLHADTPGYYNYFKKYSYIRNHEEVLRELDACYAAVQQNHAVYLIRPHPSQDRSLFTEWVKGKADAYLAAEQNLHDLLRNMDLMLARITTVCIEAIYMGKKVLQLDCDFHADFPLEKMGIAWGAKDYETLPSAIKAALSDEKEISRIKERTQQLLPREPAAPKIAGVILEKLQIA